jgi:hypothetical protein
MRTRIRVLDLIDSLSLELSTALLYMKRETRLSHINASVMLMGVDSLDE